MRYASLCLGVLHVLVLVLDSTDAGPPWWRRSHRNDGKQKDGCIVGECKKKWKCRGNDAPLPPTGPCALLRGGPWVCCSEEDKSVSKRQWNDPPTTPGGREEWRTKSDENGVWRKTTRGQGTTARRQWVDDSHTTSSSVYVDWRTTEGRTTPRPYWGKTTVPAPRRPTGDARTTKRQNWGRTTPSYGERREPWGKPTTSPKGGTTKRSSATRGSSSSTPSWEMNTRRGGRVTPVPDINDRMCGLREMPSASLRLEEEHGHGNNPDAVFLDQDSSGAGSGFAMGRIVGGREAEPFSWPWVAALYRKSARGGTRFLCAGSLINEHFVLTAAHVFTRDDLRSASFIVMLGTHNAQEAVAEYRVSSVLQHPKYQPRYYYHDIALLKLESPVYFNDYVMPICLPSPSAPLLRDEDLVGKSATVMGWGDDAFGGVSSRVLREATFPIVSRQSCNASYVSVASNRFPVGITEQMLCAGAPGGGKDACQGDSGGPLSVKVGARYTQIGIVSFGYRCGDKEFPGVYTKVAPYLGWIGENTMAADYYYSR